MTRERALEIAKWTGLVSGVAAYCYRTVAADPRFVARGAAWNERHRELQKRVVETIEKTGGMTADEKSAFLDAIADAVEQKLEEQDDKQAFCDRFTTEAKSGLLDIK